MLRIGLLSDTHSYLHPKIFDFFLECDEIWHAGDIGTMEIAGKLSSFKPLKAVSGNIDGQDVRIVFPKEIIFFSENVKVVMTHIGGYPGRYEKSALHLILNEKPQIFITGHSHILKVMYDKKYQLLFINPGAAGKFGLHRSITMVRFIIDGERIKDLEILDIPRDW
jgi:putative phosphoesterase